MEFRTNDAGGYLLLTITGEWELDVAIPMLETVRVEASRQGLDRVLIDIMGMSDIPFMDRFAIGEQIARIFAGRVRVAALCPPERINHFAEDVAVNRGGVLRSFGDRQEAMDWLMLAREA